MTGLDSYPGFKMVYFGFTHCPDVCPEELDKITKIAKEIEQIVKKENIITPVFITCDPERDDVGALNNYLKGTII